MRALHSVTYGSNVHDLESTMTYYPTNKYSTNQSMIKKKELAMHHQQTEKNKQLKNE